MTRDLPGDLERKSAGWGELIEDIIGVNLRGFRTLWATIVKPVDVFEASRTLDWRGQKYSSSIRVWTFLLALLMFFQFLWAAPEGPIGEQFKASFSELPVDHPVLNAPSTIERVVQNYVFLYPILLLAISFVTSMLLHIWGKGTKVVERIRLLYVAVLPGTAIVVLTTPLILFVPSQWALHFTAASFFAIFLADSTTVFRGLVTEYTVSARAWRAIFLGALMQLVYTVVSILSVILVTLWTFRNLELN